MSRELFKMNMIASVQKLDDEDIEIIQNYIEKIEEENNRLNNIINELEKDIDLELYKTRRNDEYNKGLINAFRYAKDKLQELKGSESNE